MDSKFLILFGVIILLVLLPQDKWFKVLSYDNLKVFVILVFAVPIAFLLDEKIGKKLVGRINRETFAIEEASLIGIATPGPVYAMFPLTGKLKKRRVKPSILVSFLTGQTSIGQIRLMMEAGIFGINFIVAKILAAFVVSAIAGLATVPLDRKLE